MVLVVAAAEGRAGEEAEPELAGEGATHEARGLSGGKRRKTSSISSSGSVGAGLVAGVGGGGIVVGGG